MGKGKAVKPRRRKVTKKTLSPLGPFEVGQIVALLNEGYTSHRTIATKVRKADGGVPGFGSVGVAVRRLAAEPGWTGERREGSGRPRATTEKDDAELERVVRERRGKEKLTSRKLRVRVTAFKKLKPVTVRRRLTERGIKWLRRRKKTLIEDEDREVRKEWAHWVLRQSLEYLSRWVYSDGVTFYLDRTDKEFAQSKRRALGTHVWRKTDQKEALYHDCVGASSYKKAQGRPVRVWGLLVDGELKITVLEDGLVMNRWNYEWVVRQRFAKWLEGKESPILIQDRERCLWCEEPVAAIKECGIHLLHRQPSNSPDLNAIENAWGKLRSRLDDTITDEREDRDAFIVRLRYAVQWVNKHNQAELAYLCTNQKERAAELLDVTDGARTQW
eukprot:10740280-Karenia_brevis.AAC.1